MKLKVIRNSENKMAKFIFNSDNDEQLGKEMTFNFDLKSESTTEIEGMFNFILDNIDGEWSYDDSELKDDGTLEYEIISCYFELIKKEIGEIKSEISKLVM
jgi:hypothetical protein